jgi:hypothetical protein
MGFTRSIGFISLSNVVSNSPGKKEMRPFTATAKTEYEQRLPDGNVLRGVTIDHVARDSSGKTRNETVVGCERGEDGQLHARVNVNVFDPAARATTTWSITSGLDDPKSPKTAYVFHMPAPAIPAKRPTAEELEKRRKLMQSQQPHEQVKTEKLGTMNVNGIFAEGTRTTRTIPAGEEGNDLPLELVTEGWTSSEFATRIEVIDYDPRRGRATYRLQDINLGQPDPSLFEPPPDYKIEEQHPLVQAAVPVP